MTGIAEPTLALDIVDGRLSWVASDGRTAPVVRGGDGDTPDPAEPATIEVPDDLTAVEDRDTLVTLGDSLRAEVKRIGALDDPQEADIARAGELAEAWKKVTAEVSRRDGEREGRKSTLTDIVGELGGDDPEPEVPADGDPAAPDAPPAEGDPTPADAPAEAPTGELVAAGAADRLRVPLKVKKPTLNPALRDIAAHAPAAPVPDRRPPVEIFAAADVPGVSAHTQLETLAALTEAVQAKANSMGVGHGAFTQGQLCSIARKYDVVLDETTPQAEVERALRGIIDPVLQAGGMEALVAAGGWCAPSQIRYEFFNIADAPTLIDVPRVGIQRGGLRWPDSLSLPDFFALSGAPASGIPTASTMPWEWTEADDIATITGSGAKVCLRPPCPDFLEARLRAFGVCVTAGNLTADAYPELIQHFIRLVLVAHERVMNRRHIAQMVALATAVTPQASTAKDTVPAILGNAELYAIHTREKFGMNTNAVVEYALPSWVRGPMRSDMAKRNGWDPGQFTVTDEAMADWFDARRIRVQFPTDWQTLPGSAGPANTIGAATAPTNWPTTVQGLMFAPGTYFIGGGMQLRLGLIRDSVLNAENDHTAEWSEEATLVGMFGHEALLVNNSIEAGGETVVLSTTPANVGP